MALKNLFAGQQWRNRPREQTQRRGGGSWEMERVRCMARVAWTLTVLQVR